MAIAVDNMVIEERWEGIWFGIWFGCESVDTKQIGNRVLIECSKWNYCSYGDPGSEMLKLA